MVKAIRWTPEMLEAHRKKLGKLAEGSAGIVTVKQAPKRSKYASQKVEDAAGIKHDSKKEARRWDTLNIMQMAGKITDLRRQVKFELIPPQRRDDGVAERACTYIADFVYVQDGKTIVADAKGMKTKDYIIKRKLMLMIHKITIKEI